MTPLSPVIPFTSLVHRQSDYIDSRVLAAATHEAHTVPAAARYVKMIADVAFWYEVNGTAAIPAADVTNGTASSYVPANSAIFVLVTGGGTIGLISAGTPVISLEFFE